jgi:THO complex subunit 5
MENRGLLSATRGIKRKSEEFKRDLDAKQQVYTNLQYEKFHYQGEIAAVEAYESVYQNIPLIPEEEYRTSHPNASNDEHSLTLERLNFEFSERKRLVALTSELNNVKEKLAKINAIKQIEIKKMDADLDALITVKYFVIY